MDDVKRTMVLSVLSAVVDEPVGHDSPFSIVESILPTGVKHCVYTETVMWYG